MINPLEGQNIETRGRGLGRVRGDDELALRPMPGDYEPGMRPLPGDYRMAGSRIKGMSQYDPMIYRKLFA